ncbi:DDE-type integrase/transposase/recombinase [Proteiniclasticum ruminis]|uniref:Integrase core domain-containing protein n=1 Tax=Proteiniclasticum ruminis TaxID=398199 RepID=A0A1I5ETN8_9CLOT|nr:DDE-type integrase/transposase/recombinase [Proteiniclasticum ruminis]SFO14875.1 Integrase core domain-containing protein [Proteiniclasticum ruminis]
MKLLVNALINIDETIYRVLWIDSEYYVIISMTENKMPIFITKIELDKKISKGKVEEHLVVEIPIQNSPIIKKDEEKRESDWNKLKVFLKNEPDIYFKKFRTEQIKKYKHNIGYSEQYINILMKKYWRGGKTNNVFLPQYKNCGAPGKNRGENGLKRGRPSKYTGGVNVTEKWKNEFSKALNKYYYSKSKNSITMTYHLMRKDVLERGIEDIPTVGQFRYWFLKNRRVKSEIVSRYSGKKYLRDYRPLLGNNSDTLPGVFEIDAHIGDVYLTSDFNRKYIIGRPTVYIAIDKFSRIICGMYVGFDSSYSNAAMALKNCVSDKVEFCKHYGIPIEPEQWPVAALPNKLVADRGEIEGTSIENLIESLGIEVELMPSSRADLKGIVEGFFNLTNSHIKSLLPGKIDLDGRERGDGDYRKSATLTMREYTAIIIHTILYYNNCLLMNYNRTPKMIEDDLVPTPINLWNWGLENFGANIRYGSQEVILALMTKAEASITRRGIKYKSMYYASSSLTKNGYFDRGANKLKKVHIYLDSRNLSYIYIENPYSMSIEKCELLPTSHKFKDKSIEDCEILINQEADIRKQFSDNNSNKRTELIREIENIVSKAQAEMTFDVSTREVKNIRENRKIEKQKKKTMDAFELDL